MYESTEGQAFVRPSAEAVGVRAGEATVDAAFATLLDEVFAGPRVTYPPVQESPVYYGGHRRGRHRRFVLRAGADLDDPR